MTSEELVGDAVEVSSLWRRLASATLRWPDGSSSSARLVGHDADGLHLSCGPVPRDADSDEVVFAADGRSYRAFVGVLRAHDNEVWLQSPLELHRLERRRSRRTAGDGVQLKIDGTPVVLHDVSAHGAAFVEPEGARLAVGDVVPAQLLRSGAGEVEVDFEVLGVRPDPAGRRVRGAFR